MKLEIFLAPYSQVGPFQMASTRLLISKKATLNDWADILHLEQSQDSDFFPKSLEVDWRLHDDGESGSTASSDLFLFMKLYLLRTPKHLYPMANIGKLLWFTPKKCLDCISTETSLQCSLGMQDLWSRKWNTKCAETNLCLNWTSVQWLRFGYFTFLDHFPMTQVYWWLTRHQSSKAKQQYHWEFTYVFHCSSKIPSP